MNLPHIIDHRVEENHTDKPCFRCGARRAQVFSTLVTEKGIHSNVACKGCWLAYWCNLPHPPSEHLRSIIEAQIEFVWSLPDA